MAATRLSSIKTVYNNVSSQVATAKAAHAESGAEGNFIRASFDQWNKERLQRKKEEVKGQEKVALFPGWATRRFPPSDARLTESMHVLVLNLAITHVPYSDCRLAVHGGHIRFWLRVQPPASRICHSLPTSVHEDCPRYDPADCCGMTTVS